MSNLKQKEEKQLDMFRARILPDDIPTVVSPHIWSKVPPLIAQDEMMISTAGNHSPGSSQTVTAGIRIAHDDEALYLRVQVWDDQLDPRTPLGHFELALCDSNPDVSEWPHFSQAHSLFVVQVDSRNARVLRFDTMMQEQSPTRPNPVSSAVAGFELTETGMVYELRLPWKEMGSLRPGVNNPFLLQMNFGRPDSSSSRPPTLLRWVEFR